MIDAQMLDGRICRSRDPNFPFEIFYNTIMRGDGGGGGGVSDR